VDVKTLLYRFASIAGDEARRNFIFDALGDLGYAPRVDTAGNVLAGDGPVWFAAHYDTVLLPTPVERREGRWYAPGIGDNSSGVVLLLALADPSLPVGFAFTTGEEGLGNLKGARTLLRRVKPQVFIAVDGYLGSLVGWAVGSERLEATFVGPGGHAWGDRGAPSSVYGLGLALASLYSLPLERDESLNVGRVWGGTAINAIPSEAGLWLDLRAKDPEVLARRSREARSLLAQAADRARVKLILRRLGYRPAGRTAPDWLLEVARDAYLEAGVEPEHRAASTDAAAAIEVGVPAVALGVYRGGGAHTASEWVDPDSLVIGLRVLKSLLRRLRERGWTG